MQFNFRLEDIKYSKIVYKDNMDTSCTIKTAIRKISDREIIACAKYDEHIFVSTPQEVKLSIICSDGLYKTQTVLKSVENDEPYVFFILETPKGLEYQQNREYFRILAAYRCVYYVDGRDFEAQTYDISANGISIIMPMHIISETDSILEFYIDGKKLRTKIDFVRSEKVENGYKLSFKFPQLTQLERDIISQACIKNQLEAKRNALK